MKNIRLLLLGAFNEGALENFYLKGFRREGVEVFTFDIISPYFKALHQNTFNKIINRISPDVFYKPINTALIQFLENQVYDVILVFKGMELFPDTISLLKSRTHILANYNPDHPFTFWSAGSGNKNVRDSIKLYDLHFSYSKRITGQLQEQFEAQAYCIPFGYDSDCKIGKVESTYRFENKFLFIGAYDRERAQYLDATRSMQLNIYGDIAWDKRNWAKPFLRKAFMHKKLYNEEYTEAISTSKGVINLLRPQNMQEDSHNMRTFEVPGFGGVLIAQRTVEQMEYFKEDTEAVFFDSTEELKDKLSFLDRNPLVGEQIKINAVKRSVSGNYSYNERSKQLLDVLKSYLHQ